jgi:hypothetical protein
MYCTYVWRTLHAVVKTHKGFMEWWINMNIWIWSITKSTCWVNNITLLYPCCKLPFHICTQGCRAPLFITVENAPASIASLRTCVVSEPAHLLPQSWDRAFFVSLEACSSERSRSSCWLVASLWASKTALCWLIAVWLLVSGTGCWACVCVLTWSYHKELHYHILQFMLVNTSLIIPSFVCSFQRSTCRYTAHGYRTSRILCINHIALLHIKQNTILGVNLSFRQ